MSHHYVTSSVAHSICQIFNNLENMTDENNTIFNEIFNSVSNINFINSVTRVDSDSHYFRCLGTRNIVINDSSNQYYLEFRINYPENINTETDIFVYLISEDNYSYFINPESRDGGLVEVNEDNKTFRYIRLVSNDFLRNL